MHDLLNEQEETLEDIKMDGIHLIQKKKGFRYGMDAIILSQFAHVTDKTRAIDLGTGTGIISLLVREKSRHLSRTLLWPTLPRATYALTRWKT